jgi:hypothetical protein
VNHRETRTCIGGGEGFAIYIGECEGKYLLIFDESTTIGLLSEEDAQGMSGEKIVEFSSAQERSRYLTTIHYKPFSRRNGEHD